MIIHKEIKSKCSYLFLSNWNALCPVNVLNSEPRKKKERGVLKIWWWREENTYISVELPNKAWEIVVFEVSWEEICGEWMRIPHNKAATSFVPRDYVIGSWVIHHVIGLGQEWWWPCIIKALHWLWWRHHRRPRRMRWTWSQILFFYWIQWIHC